MADILISPAYCLFLPSFGVLILFSVDIGSHDNLLERQNFMATVIIEHYEIMRCQSLQQGQN